VNAVQIETITSDEGLAELRPEWDELVLAMPRPSPFLLHGWISAWWSEAAQRDWRLGIHVARRDGRLIGALPLAQRRTGGLRVTHFVGGHLSSLCDLMLAPGVGDDVATALATQAAAGRHDFMDVFGLPADSRLARAVGSDRMTVVMRTEAPVLSLEPGWDAVYTARTSAKRRSLHRRRRRQLAEQGDVTTTVAREPEEVTVAVDEAIRLHAARREGRLDDSGFSDGRGAFQREALIALAAQDRTRIVTLRLDDRPIAYHCYLALAGTMYVHSLAFDPAYGRWSPGLLTTLETLAVADAEGLHRVEFLGGAERYKIELADGTEPMYRGIGLARGVHGRAAVAASVGGIALRLRAKRSRTVRRIYIDGLSPVRRARARLSGRHPSMHSEGKTG
jgi:CelD/BcsL family acetyltransferase involved in cellulose biosynthesis